MRSLLVTGSDTGVGKTRVAGEIAAALHCAGLAVQIVKVIETGVHAGEQGDASAAAARCAEAWKRRPAASAPQPIPPSSAPASQAPGRLAAITLFSFGAPIAPAAAAEAEGKRLVFHEILAACRGLPPTEVRIYEGAGGIATPLDASGSDWADFAAALPVDELIIVVPDRLGAINQARLCAARAAACGLRSSVCLNPLAPVPPEVARSTRHALQTAGLPLVGAGDIAAQLIARHPSGRSSPSSATSQRTFPAAAIPAQPDSATPQPSAPNPPLSAQLSPASPLVDRARSDLAEREGRHLRRHLAVSSAGSLLNLADNDYLDLARDPAVTGAAAEAARRHGASASASPLITGWKPPHEDLVAALCAWLGFPCGLLWTSGYAANSAVLGTLPRKGDLICADRLVHASMIAGLTRSGARFKRYPHLDLARLEADLRSRPGDAGAVFVVTETVFSMDGDYPDLARLAQLKREHGFILIVDEAHGLGWYGPGGAGLIAEAGIAAEVDVLVGTLGKTLGSGGAFTLFREAVLRDYLVNHAGEFIFSTALPPPAAAAALAAIGRVREFAADQRSWRDQSARFRGQLRAAGWNAPEGDSPIVPVQLGDEAAALALAQSLRQQGILVAAVRPPTVPAGTSRLRFSLKRTFDEAAAKRVLQALDEARKPPSRFAQTRIVPPEPTFGHAPGVAAPGESAARFAWVLGWAVSPEWFAGLVREAFPEGEHHFIPASPRFRADLERIGPCDLTVGYSLGSLLLLDAAGQSQSSPGWSAWSPCASASPAEQPPTAPAPNVALLAPIWDFPQRAARRALRLQLKSDPAAALAGFYRSTGLDDAASFPPPPQADLLWGLDQLDRLSLPLRLPSGWLALIGADDPLLDAASLAKSVPELRVISGGHHPRLLLAALAQLTAPESVHAARKQH